MNTLTEKERKGLEDVFNSIQIDKTQHTLSSYLSSILLLGKSGFSPKLINYKMQKDIKLTKFSQLVGNYLKKKKNLSK